MKAEQHVEPERSLVQIRPRGCFSHYVYKSHSVYIVMQLYQFDYKTEKTEGKSLTDNDLVAILTKDKRSRIVYDTEGFLGSNKNFGINYGQDCKKGFMHNDVEYTINIETKTINVSQPKANLFFDADKRDSFATYKVKFESVDEVLNVFVQDGYKISQD